MHDTLRLLRPPAPVEGYVPFTRLAAANPSETAAPCGRFHRADNAHLRYSPESPLPRIRVNRYKRRPQRNKKERVMGFEPTTTTLATLCSAS